MAKVKSLTGGAKLIESKPKKTRQGMGKNTNLSATSRNAKRKKYRGQGR
jgi:hypothetical protein